MRNAITLAGSLLAAPLLGFGQAAPAPVPRYYAGLAVFSSDFQALSGGGYRSLQVPVLLTAGYQWRPRLAAQLGVAYSTSNASYFSAGRYGYGLAAATPFAYYEYASYSRQHTVSVPLLLRYTLTRRLAHRFQADALAGLTLSYQQARASSTQTYLDSTRAVAATSSDDWQYHHTTAYLTAGIGLRYRLGRRLEAQFDITLNRDLAHLGTSYGLAGALALGARYRFGTR